MAFGTLLGFSDFFDEVGAAKPPSAKPAAKPATKAKPSGKYYKAPAKPKATKVVQQHSKVLAKAKQTLLKAGKSLGRAQMSLAKKPTPVRAPAGHVPPAAPRTVKAARRVAAVRSVVGAAAVAVTKGAPVTPNVAAAQSPKAKAAIQKHNAAVTAAKGAAQKLAKQTLQTKKVVQALAKRAVSQKKVSKLLRTPLKKRAGVKVGELLDHPEVGEEVAEALLGYYAEVGADPDPANPGYLTDGSPDPAFASAAPAPMDTGISDADLSVLDDASPIDSGVDLPPPVDMSTFIPDMNAVGGIAYDGSKGTPNGYVGSYGLFTKATRQDAPGGAVAGSDPGKNDYGYVWGSFDQDNVPNGIPWGGRLQENAWNAVFGRYVRYGEGEFNHPVDPSEAFSSNTKTAPNNAPYGPLIGNPGMKDFVGMRVDAAGNMFWLPQEAPDWLTFPMRQAAALTAKAEKEAEEAEKKQFALEQEKAARDAAAAQAAQDAANALAESQAASEAKIAQQEEGTKQAQEETAQAQQETAAETALVEAQRADTAQQASQAQQEQQAQQILIERAQRQAKLLEEAPELEAALMLQDAGLLAEGGDEAEEGGEEPSYEETADFSEPEAESDKFRHPSQDDDYEASGFEDDSGGEYSEG